MTTLPDQTTGSLALRLKRGAFSVLPRRLRLPVRVGWMRATGSLEPEIAEIARLLPRGGTAVDIGANHGVYSFFLVRHFDTVVAFEPQPACTETLEGWGRDRVEVRAIALSDHAGDSTLSIPVTHGVVMTGYARLGTDGEPDDCVRLDVPVERLDDQRLTDVRFIKIDVEGHELEVLRGGEQLLRRDRPTLLIEIEQRHLGGDRTVADVVSYLGDLGYAASFRTDQATWTDFGEFDPAVHQVPEAVGRPGYVSMFLFRPEAR